MKIWLALVALVLATGLQLQAAEGGKRRNRGGDGGGGGHGGGAANLQPEKQGTLVDFVLAHAKDLELNEKQVEALTKLQSAVNAQREKLKADPEIAASTQKFQEARLDGNRKELRAARRELAQQMEKKSTDMKQLTGWMEQILTPEQKKKLTELRLAEMKKNGQSDPAEPPEMPLNPFEPQ